MRSSPSARHAPRRAVPGAPGLRAARGALPTGGFLSTSGVRAAALGALLALAACGRDTDPLCDRSYLRYDNFGSPFLVNWCRACHSAGLPPDMRQLAPANVNFDTLAEIRAWSTRIDYTTAHGSSMPPAGGPSSDERDMLGEWLRCGAR